MAIDSYPAVALMTILTSVLAAAGLLVARRMMGVERLKHYHEVGGSLLQIVATMYAVLLGLIVVDAMTKFQTARNITEQEANALADVFLLAEHLPAAEKSHVQKLCLDYTNDVINHEWKAMDDATVSPAAQRAAVSLMKTIMSFEPKTQSEQGIYPLAVQEVCQIWDARRARLNFSSYGLPAIEWVALIAGGIVTVVFTYFFAIENWKVQMSMTVMVTLIISLNLYLVVLFGYPFSGDLRVWPDAFRVDKSMFAGELGMAADSPAPIR